MIRRAVVLSPVIVLALTTALLLPATPAATAPPSLAVAASSAAGRAASVALTGSPSAPAAPTLRIETVVSGLDIPWDVAFVGKIMLFTERDREKISARMPDGELRTLIENPSGMWHSGETGLMGITVDPDFATNRRIYTCNGFDNGAQRDVRVVRYVINAAFTAATAQANIVEDIEITASGRHGGCRLRFGPGGALYVSTGDAAIGTNPQDKTSLNGKVLRVNAENGDPWPGNPYIGAADPKQRLVYTYGQRNVQGLDVRPGGGMWSVEHGTYRDDEVNRLRAGANFGYNPVPGYNEDVPMTDHSLPGRQIDAKWSSGTPTIATSGGNWLRGANWGTWKGRFVAAALVGEQLRLLEFDRQGELVSQLSIPQFAGTYGRLRTAQMGPGHALYVTTSNGSGTDRILKVTATS